jgi:hypothetical protein
MNKDPTKKKETKKEEKAKRPKLTVEELEKRLTPSFLHPMAFKPGYGPGTKYGLVRRDNLTW